MIRQIIVVLMVSFSFILLCSLQMPLVNLKVTITKCNNVLWYL